MLVCWELLVKMLNFEGMTVSEVRENMEKANRQMEGKILENTKRFLEEQYAEYVRNTVRSSGASRAASTHKLVADFSLQMAKEERGAASKRDAHSAPFWMVLFFLLRTGNKEEALRIVESSDLEISVKTVFSLFCDPRQPRPEQELKKVDKLYNMAKKSDGGFPLDQKYQVAVLNLVAKCEPANSPSFKSITKSIFRTTEDFVWLQLCFVEQPHVLPSDTESHAQAKGQTMDEVKNMILRYERHFKKAHPLLFFQVLLMTQQFEAAVLELFGHKEYKVEGVHFAIVFYLLGLLPTSAHLSFEVLVGEYVKFHFLDESDSIKALYYYFLVTDSKSRNDMLSELVSLHYELFLGNLSDVEAQNKGLLAKFVSTFNYEPETVMDVRERCARKAEERGRYLEAILLFDGCKKFDKVMKLLIEQVSRVASHNTSERANLIQLATRMFHAYSSLSASVANRRDLEILSILLFKLVPFFDACNNSKLAHALSIAEKSELLDLERTDISLGRQRAQHLKQFSREIGQIIGEFLEKVMLVIKDLFLEMKLSRITQRQNQLGLFEHCTCTCLPSLGSSQEDLTQNSVFRRKAYKLDRKIGAFNSARGSGFTHHTFRNLSKEKHHKNI